MKHNLYWDARGEEIRVSRQDVLQGLAPARTRHELEIEGRTLALTNLDKPLFPEAGLTKRDLGACDRLGRRGGLGAGEG